MLLPTLFVEQGKRCLFYWSKLYTERVGHMHDVCSKIEAHLYEFKDSNREFDLEVNQISVPEYESLLEKGELVPYCENETFIIPKDDLDIYKFKGLELLTGYDVFLMIKDQMIEKYIGKEINFYV